MPEEDGRRIGADLVKSFQVAKAGILVDEGILIEFPSLCFADKTGRWDVLDVDLDPLSRIEHLLVGFRHILGIGKFDGHLSAADQDPVQTGDRAGIPSLSQFDPEDDDTGVGVSFPHVADQRQLLLGVLVGVAMGTMRLVTQRC